MAGIIHSHEESTVCDMYTTSNFAGDIFKYSF